MPNAVLSGRIEVRCEGSPSRKTCDRPHHPVHLPQCQSNGTRTVALTLFSAMTVVMQACASARHSSSPPSSVWFCPICHGQLLFSPYGNLEDLQNNVKGICHHYSNGSQDANAAMHRCYNELYLRNGPYSPPFSKLPDHLEIRPITPSWLSCFTRTSNPNPPITGNMLSGLHSACKLSLRQCGPKPFTSGLRRMHI